MAGLATLRHFRRWAVEPANPRPAHAHVSMNPGSFGVKFRPSVRTRQVERRPNVEGAEPRAEGAGPSRGAGREIWDPASVLTLGPGTPAGRR